MIKDETSNCMCSNKHIIIKYNHTQNSKCHVFYKKVTPLKIHKDLPLEMTVSENIYETE